MPVGQGERNKNPGGWSEMGTAEASSLVSCSLDLATCYFRTLGRPGWDSSHMPQVQSTLGEQRWVTALCWLQPRGATTAGSVPVPLLTIKNIWISCVMARILPCLVSLGLMKEYCLVSWTFWMPSETIMRSSSRVQKLHLSWFCAAAWNYLVALHVRSLLHSKRIKYCQCK